MQRNERHRSIVRGEVLNGRPPGGNVNCWRCGNEGMREMGKRPRKLLPPEAVKNFLHEVLPHALIPSPCPLAESAACLFSCTATSPLASAKWRRIVQVPGTPVVVMKLPFSASDR